MKWINIKDKLPEDDQNVLVINEKCLLMNPIKAYYESELDIFFSIESIGTEPLNVTHWSPLSKFPWGENEKA